MITLYARLASNSFTTWWNFNYDAEFTFPKPFLEILSKLSFECWSARLQIEFFQVLFQFATDTSRRQNGVNEAPKKAPLS